MPIWLINFIAKENWAFNGSDVIQILLSIVGFGIAIWQIRKTNNSVEAAEIAAKDAQDSIKERFAIIDSTEVVNGIKLLKDSIGLKKYEKARWLLDDISIRIIQLSKRADFIDTDEKRTEIRKIIKLLSNLEPILIDGEKDPDKLNIDDIKTISVNLSEIMRVIYGWSEKRKFSRS